MDNNEIVTELYALRAGLSLIAKESDKLNAELDAANSDKALKITQARNEASAKITKDFACVRRDEALTENRVKEINDDVSYQVQEIDDEIKARQREIQKLQNTAMDAAELGISDCKPTEDREKYEEIKKRYNKNKQTMKKSISSLNNYSSDITKGIFCMLFCMLHILTAAYECWSLYSLNLHRWTFWVALLVALGIMITVCALAHDDWIDYDSDEDSSLNKYFLVAFLCYTGYIINIAVLLSSAIIVRFGGAADSVTGLTVSIYVATALVLIITGWRMIKYLGSSDVREYTALNRKKRKALSENKKLEKELKKACELDEEWRKYDNLKFRVRSDAKEKSEVEILKSDNVKSRTRANILQGKANSEIESLNEALEARKREHEEFKRITDSECEAQCKDIEAKYEEVCAVLTENRSKISSEIWDTLVNTYGKMLDVRDWHILDLVIWQLETGRADTIKEALQLADRETQTERIERAMESASRSIADQIGMGFGNLQVQLNRNFSSLASGIAATAKLISWKFDDLSREVNRTARHISESISLTTESIAALNESQRDSMLAVSKSFDEIASQSSLQTALLEKANNSSDQLISIANKMRENQKKYIL